MVTAMLGPTNTGKTHYAIERMLSHRSGVIGFPLRLLAREVYDRIVAMRGPRDVALVTGEEKIVPAGARFHVCTVESMPLDYGADFVAIDEIQLCADADRGHVFTNRLLHARGRRETLFLGSATMRERIAALAPGVRFLSRERLSELTYAGSKKLSRLPPRSAVVAFSAENVYAIAELIRRQKGGAAVVMGALSPRTRNAQVALYQEGDVDYLVATDAIGMGLNMDVRHVSFAGLRKFDGRRHRHLEPNELAQIAGRAGRYMDDGTFGVTGEAPPLDEDVVQSIEQHRFRPVDRLQWRNHQLDYATPFNLMLSLERDPDQFGLTRAREADDLLTLRFLTRDQEILDIAKGRPLVKLLWDVCQVPDFRKTIASEHAALIAQLYRFLIGESGVIPEDWIANHCSRLDRIEGDIDALSKRLAYIRTWTYVANRSRWLDDPGHWRGVTRAIEDKLSDALHERLTQRFVDRRTSVLARRLKQKESLVATVDESGSVTVEGEFVGRLEGFRFQPDPTAAGAEEKTLQAASAQALQAELSRRVDQFYSAPDPEIDVTEQGGMMWGSAAVGRLEPKTGDGDPLAVRAVAFADDMLDPALKEKIERRLQFWIDSKLKTVFEPLMALRADEEIAGLARGVAFQILERFGVIARAAIADDVKALDQDSRSKLRKHGVRFGQHTVFIPALLKPAPTRFRLILWGLSEKLDEIPSPPPPGHVTIPAQPGVPEGYYAMAGYRLCGPRALRLDMLERLADMIRPLDTRGGFEATPEMLSITGATLEQFAELMQGLGFAAEKGERPKQTRPAKSEAEQNTETAETTQAEVGAETPAAEAAGPDETAETVAEAGAAALSSEPEASEAPAPTVAAESAEATTETTSESDAPAEASETVAQEAAAEVGADAPTVSEGAAEETAAEASAPRESAADQAGAEEGAAEAASDEPVEIEVFFTFRTAPRNRNRRQGGPRRGNEDRRPQRGAGGGGKRHAEGQSGGDRAQGGGERGHGGSHGGPGGDKRKRGKPDGRRGEGGHGQKPREYKAGGGGRREKRADPDSPFAILQQLKDKS